MSTSNQSPELAARITVARSTLAAFQAERVQDHHLVDWLSEAVKLSTALAGVLGELEADPGPGDHGFTSGSGGVTQPGHEPVLPGLGSLNCMICGYVHPGTRPGQS